MVGYLVLTMAGPTVAPKDGKWAEQKAVVKVVWRVDLKVAWRVGLTVEYLVGKMVEWTVEL